MERIVFIGQDNKVETAEDLDKAIQESIEKKLKEDALKEILEEDAK